MDNSHSLNGGHLNNLTLGLRGSTLNPYGVFGGPLNVDAMQQKPAPFDSAALLKRLEELYADNINIAQRKNADYADADPFKNFRSCERHGIPVEKGMLVRMEDKMCRIGNLLDRQAQVSDESIFDTLSDLANYAMLLRVWLEQKQK